MCLVNQDQHNLTIILHMACVTIPHSVKFNGRRAIDVWKLKCRPGGSADWCLSQFDRQVTADGRLKDIWTDTRKKRSSEEDVEHMQSNHV